MAQIILDIDGAQAVRIQDALTETFRLEQPATIQDAKAYIISNLKQFVRSSEKRIANAAAEAGAPPDIEIT